MKKLTILCAIAFSGSALATGGTPSAPCYTNGEMTSANTLVTVCAKTVNSEKITLKEHPLTATNSYDWITQENIDGGLVIALKQRPSTATNSYDWNTQG